jgi:hypothetical protein
MAGHTSDALVLKTGIKERVDFADLFGRIDARETRDSRGLLSLQGRMTAQTIIKLILMLPVRLKHRVAKCTAHLRARPFRIDLGVTWLTALRR